MKLRKQDPSNPRRQDEVIEVEVERLGIRPSRIEAIRGRAIKIFKPVVLGVLIDLGDVVTGSPILAPISLPIGVMVGYFFAKCLDALPSWRFISGALVGLYWAFPFTSWIPLAALIAAFVTLFKPDMMQHEPFAPEK